MRVLALVLLLAACSTTPTRYVPRSWAKGPLEQAQQECYMAIQKNDNISITTCLQAKGWYEASR